MELSKYFQGETLQRIETSLEPDNIYALTTAIDTVDNYTDATSYDEIMGEWMDTQGYANGIDHAVASYEDLLNKLKEANLVTIPPYAAVETILELLTPLSSKSSELSEATTQHDNEPRPTRMESPDISDIPPYTSCWSGFYIGDQLESILVDKYGTERGEKTFNGLLDTGNNAIYKVCGDIMREKYKMLVDMGEKPRRYDYFDVNYFNLWKAWVANKGRKATKTGTIIPPVIKEGGEIDTDSIKDQIVNICKFSNMQDRYVQVLNSDQSITVKLYATVDTTDEVITSKAAINEMLHNYGLRCNWKFRRSGTPNEGIITGTISLIVPSDMDYNFSQNENTNLSESDTTSLENFLNEFPDDATSWSQATDAIRDLARTAKEYYNELDLDVLENDPSALQPLDFRSFKSPAEWNVKGKEYIRNTYSKMSPSTKQKFLDRFSSWLK